MITDPRFCTNTARVKNRTLVDQAIGEWFAERDSAEALEIMQKAGATVGPVYSVADAMEDQHFQQRGVFVDVEDAALGSIPMHNITPRFSGSPGAFRLAAPELGADTEAVLVEAGMSGDAIAKMQK